MEHNHRQAQRPACPAPIPRKIVRRQGRPVRIAVGIRFAEAERHPKLELLAPMHPQNRNSTRGERDRAPLRGPVPRRPATEQQAATAEILTSM